MDHNSADRNPVLFQAGKLYNYFRYLEQEDIEDDMVGHLNTALERVYGLHEAITEMYFEPAKVFVETE
jgi:hypothetical protein